MKLLLVGNYELDRQFSMQGFAGALQGGLANLGVAAKYIVPEPRYGRKGNKWLGYLDKYALFPREIRRQSREADLVHILDQGNAMYVRHLRQKPHLLTCHDVLAIRAARGEIPDWNTGTTGKIYQRLILSGISNSRRIVCVSQTTQRDLIALLPGVAARLSVIYNGLFRKLNRIPDQESEAVLERLGIAPPFLLHVGGNQHYKNRKGLVEIYRHLCRMQPVNPPSLVLAGHPPPESFRSSLPEGAILAVRPSDRELEALYSSAQALVFPSLFEGFGLPILEAQSLGCPVFASNRSPMTEVGGNAAVYFDPCDQEEAAATILRELPDIQQRAQLGIENSHRFSSERMLEGYLSEYHAILRKVR